MIKCLILIYVALIVDRMMFNRVEIYQMIQSKLLYFVVAIGVLLVLPVLSHAGSPVGQLTFQVGLGKVSFDEGLNTTALIAKGYTVNGYSQGTIDKDSLSLGISMSLTRKISAELGLQKMGKVKSSLDISLPTGISTEQAAKDITEASPQQLGGLTAIVGASYAQPINHRLDLKLGVGVSFGKNDHRVAINGEAFDSDDTSTAPYLKLGFGVKVTPKITITTHAERYFFDDTIDRYSIGLSYTY